VQPSGQAATDAAGLVSDVPVIRDLPSQTRQRSSPLFSDGRFAPHRVNQNTPLSSVDPCRHSPLVLSPLPQNTTRVHLSILCLTMSRLNAGLSQLACLEVAVVVFCCVYRFISLHYQNHKVSTAHIISLSLVSFIAIHSSLVYFARCRCCPID
jgi:hypothetical protein